MGIFPRRRRRNPPLDSEMDINANVSLYFNNTVELPTNKGNFYMAENATYCNDTLVQDEVWETVRKSRPRRGYQERQSHRSSLLTTPECMLGVTQVALLCIYLLLFHMVWVRPRFRARKVTTAALENKTTARSTAAKQQSEQPSVERPSTAKDLPTNSLEYGTGLALEEQQDTMPPNSEEGSEKSKTSTGQTIRDPNSFTTPERSRAMAQQQEVARNCPDFTTESTEEPQQIFYPNTASLETLTQQLQEQKDQWLKFQQDTKAKEAESKQQLQQLMAQLQEEEQQRLANNISSTSQYQNIASTAEQVESEMNTNEHAVSGVADTAIQLSCDDLRAQVQSLQGELSAFQKDVKTKNREYASQVETLESDISRSVSAASLSQLAAPATTADASHLEEDSPETSRPPPSDPSTFNTSSPLSLEHDNTDSVTEATSNVFQPVTTEAAQSTNFLPTSTSIAVPAPKSASVITEPVVSTKSPFSKAITRGYGDLLNEVQMLTNKIQKTDTHSLPTNDVTDPQCYTHVLEKHLKERAADCARLESQLSRLQYQLGHQESEIVRLRANGKAEKASLMTQIQTLVASQALSQERLTQHHTKNASLSAEKESLIRQVAEMEQMQKMAQDRPHFDWESKLGALNREYQETSSNLQAKLTIEIDNRLELAAKNERLSTELDQCRADSDRREQEFVHHARQMKQELCNEQEKQQQQLAVHEEQRAIMTARVDSLQQELVKVAADMKCAQSKASQKEQVLMKELYDLRQLLGTKTEQFRSHLLAKDKENDRAAEETVKVNKKMENCENFRKEMAAEFEAKEKSLNTKITSLRIQLKEESKKALEAKQHEESLRQELMHSQQQMKDVLDSIHSKSQSGVDTGKARFTKSQSNAATTSIDYLSRQEASCNFQAMLEAKERDFKELSSKFEDLQRELDDCQEELDDHEDEAKAREVLLAAQIQSLQTELHYATKEYKERTKEAQYLRSQVEAIQKRCTEKDKALAQITSTQQSTENSLKSTIAALKNELEGKDSRITELEAKTLQFETSLQHQDEELAELRQQSTELIKARECTETLSREVALLQQNVITSNQKHEEELDLADKELQTLKMNNTRLETLVAELTSELKPFKQKDSHLEEESLTAFVRRLVQDHANYCTELEALRAEKTRLETELTKKDVSFNERLNQMNVRFEEANTKMKHRSKELQDQKKQYEAFQINASAQEQALSSEIEELRQRLVSLPNPSSEQLDDSKTCCSDLSVLIEGLTLEVAFYKNEIRQNEANLESKKSECALLSSRLTESEHKCKELIGLEETLRKAIEKNAYLSTSSASFESALREAQAVVAEMKLKTLALEKEVSKLSVLEDSEAVAVATVQKQNNELATLRAELSRVQQQKETAESAKEALSKSVLETRLLLEGYEAKIMRAQEEAQTRSKEQKESAESARVLDETLLDYKEKVNILHEQSYSSDRQILALKARLSEKEKMCLELNAEVKSLNEHLSVQKRRSFTVETQKAEKETECAELRSKIVSLGKQVETSRKEMADADKVANQRIDILESDLAQISDCNHKLEKDREQLANTVKSLESKNTELHDSLLRCEQAFQTGLYERKTLKEEVAWLQSSRDKLREESDSVPALRAATNRIPALEASLKRIREQRQQALDKSADLEHRLRDTERRATDTEKALASNEKVIQGLIAEKKSLEEDKTSLEQGNDSLKKQVNLAKDREQVFQGLIDKLKTQIQSKTLELEKVEATKDQAIRSLKQAEASVKDLTEEVNQKHFIAQTAFGEKRAMAEKLTAIQSSEEKLKVARARIAVMETNMEKLQSERRLAIEARKSVEKKLQESESKATDLQENFLRKENDMQEVLNEVKALKQEVAAKEVAETKRAKAETYITKLESEKKEQETILSTQLAAMTKQRDECLAVSKDQEDKVRELKSELDNKECSLAQLEVMKTNLHHAERELCDSLQVNESLEMALNEAKTSGVIRDTKLANLEKDNAFYINEKNALAQELMKLKMGYAALEQELQASKNHMENIRERESLAKLAMAKQTDQVTFLEASISDLAKKLNMCCERSAILEAKNGDCALLSAELERKLTAAREEVEVLKTDKRSLFDANKKLEKSLDEQKLHVNELQGKLLSLEKVAIGQDLLESDLSSARSKVKTLDGQVSNLKKIHKKELLQMNEKVSRLQRKLQQFSEQASQLKRELEIESKAKKECEAEVEKMKSIVNVLQSNLATLEEAALAHEQLKTNMSIARSELKALEDQVCDLENANKSYLDALANQNNIVEELSELKQEKARILGELESKASELFSLQTDFRHAQQDLEVKRRMETEFHESQHIVNTLSQKLSILENESKLQCDELLDVTKKASALQQEMQEFKEQAQQLKKNLDLETERRKELESAKKQLDDQAKMQKVELLEQHDTSSKLKEELFQATKEISALQNASKEYNEEVKQLKHNLKNEIGTRKKLEAELEEKGLALKSIMKECSDLKEARCLMLHEKKLIDQECERLKKIEVESHLSLKEASKELTAFRKRVSHAEIELTNKDKHCLTLRAKLTQLEEEIKVAAKRESESAAALTEERKVRFELEARAKELLKHLDEHEVHAKKQQEQITDAKIANKEALENKVALEERLSQSNKNLDAMKEKVVDLENASRSYLDALSINMAVAKELEGLKDNHAETIIQLQSTTKKLRVQSDEIKVINEEKDALCIKLKDEAANAATIKETADKYRKELEIIGQEKKQAVVERDCLSNELAAARVAKEELQQRITDLENAAKSYLDELAKQMPLSKELEDANAAKAELEEHIKASNFRYDSLQKEMVELKADCQKQAGVAKESAMKLEENKKTHQDTLDEIERHFNILSNKVSVVTEKLQQKESQVDELERNLRATKQVHAKEIISLTEQLEECEASAVVGGALLNEQNGILAAANVTSQQFEDKTTAYTILVDKVSHLEGCVKEKQDEVVLLLEKAKEADDLVKENKFQSEELAEQQDLQKKANEKLKELMDLVQKKTEDCSSFKVEIETLMEDLRKKDQELERALDEQRLMASALTDANRQREEKEAAFANLSTDLTSTRDQLAVYESEVSVKNETSSDEMRMLKNELKDQREQCDRLTQLNRDLQTKMGEADKLCNEYRDKFTSLNREIAEQQEEIARLQEELKGKNDDIYSMQVELDAQYSQQERVNKSMAEMLALWEEKEGQCSKFKDKLEELTTSLEDRDAQITKLQKEVVQHEGELFNMKSLIDELKQQQASQEESSECMDNVLIRLKEKGKEVADLTLKLGQMATRCEEWESKFIRSENELVSLKNRRNGDLTKKEEGNEKGGDGMSSQQETKLAQHFEVLTNKVTEGEKQLAGLERELEEKWEQSVTAQAAPTKVLPHQGSTTPASTQADSNSGPKNAFQASQSKKGRGKLLSRFRR